MATVNVVLSRLQLPTSRSPSPPLAVAQGQAVDVTPSGSSQVAAVSVPAGADAANYVWRVVASGANVRLAFGTSPVANAVGDALILDGASETFGATAGGETVAIILATV